jgi:hypothetical protein
MMYYEAELGFWAVLENDINNLFVWSHGAMVMSAKQRGF